ncbi:BRO-N domain-containing protein [Pseudoteredinibacter isoporae]|uniref:BRO-N domain-containing protein n=1 Tax=Pseudoteredinibacter isoporae TaxID=570281 RepID=UPI0031079E6C
MNGDLLLLQYPESEEKIRTKLVDDEILFCLEDVVTILSAKNVNLPSTYKKGNGLLGLIMGLIEALDEDEYKTIDDHIYVKEPGLLRIIMRDNSPASKKFQRWVLHEVLPSIGKYGTYPPPVVKENSDIKRVVQSLLMEIEEREALERKVGEQFLKHEKALNALSEQISAENSHTNETHYSVEEYCQARNISPSSAQMLHGWCLKICAEGDGGAKKKVVSGTVVLSFPEHVLNQAQRAIYFPNYNNS